MTEASQTFQPPDDEGNVVDQTHLDETAGPAGVDDGPHDDHPTETVKP